MGLARSIPWSRYGLIADLAWRSSDGGQSLGKTKLQKLVYLLQELYEVDCGYEFSLYTYGPFSQPLMADLDYLNRAGGVTVQYDPSEMRGYDISPGPRCDDFRERAGTFLSESRPKIERLMAEFGQLSVKDLELRSTIVYVDRDLRSSGTPMPRTELIDLVQGIKPRFRRQAIETALRELEAQGWVTVLDGARRIA